MAPTVMSGPDEAAVLVGEGHGQSVDLELALEVGPDDVGIDPGDAAHPGLELVEVEIAEDAFKDTANLGQFLDILEAVIEKPKS